MLDRRGLQGVDSRYAAIEALGGLFIVPRDASAEDVRKEVLSRGIRALEVQTPDLGFLEGLSLEYLFVNTPRPDIEPVHHLRELRSLAVDAWTGEMDLSALPELRWLGVGEVEKDQLTRLLCQGHPALDHFAVGKWNLPDLAGLGRFPRLSHLEVGNSRSLVSLDGGKQLSALRVLELYRCPGLTGLNGIEGTGLEHLGIESCNRIADLTPLASLPNLRSVQIELRRPPPLNPLFGNRRLEFVWLIGGRRPPEELAALRDLSSTRVVQAARETWMRADGEWQSVSDIYAMTEEQEGLYERLHDERNAVKAW